MRVRPLLALGIACTLAGAAAPEGTEYVIERVTWGFRSVSGPSWSPDGFLLFCDPPESKVYKLVPGQKTQLYRDKAGQPVATGLDESGRIYLTEPGLHRVSRRAPKGDFAPLAGAWEGKTLNGPFDLAVRKDGHVFFTDPAFGSADDTRQLPFYGVYHVTPKGEMSLISRSDKRPGGIALSPNGRILYVAGADERVIRAWDVDRGGKAANERILITGIDGVPACIRVDEKGDLWVAANKLLQYSAEGARLREIPVPEPPTGVAIAAADASVLYVTGRSTVFRVRRDLKGAEAK